MLEVVGIIGRPRGSSGTLCSSDCSSAGEVAIESPLGVEFRDRRIAGVDRDAAFASALARSGSCIKVVNKDRRDVRFGRESTR